MISVERAKALEDRISDLERERKIAAEHMQRLLRVIADMQARIMAMEKTMVRPTTPTILGPTGARVN